MHKFPLSEASWELVFYKSQPDGPDDPAEDVRAKRRRVDVPAAYGIFEANQQAPGRRRIQRRIGQSGGVDGQRAQTRGRESVPTKRERAASVKEEHAPAPRQGRRRASAADVPVSLKPDVEVCS